MPPALRYTKPADLPATIPLFPLRGAILLPRATMPLNVFEPRYLTMIDHVLANDRLIGIIQPHKVDDDQESPEDNATALKPVGCAGRLSAFQELDDGRILISLTGISRFRVTGEVTGSSPFRTAMVDFAAFPNDCTAGHGEADVDRDTLLDGLRNYLERNQLEADWDAIAKASTELLVNSLSVISPFGPEEKQALLEAPDLQRRAQTLVALAEMELATDDRTGGNIQ